MSAHLSPDELKRIAPDVYAREFGQEEKPPEKTPKKPPIKSSRELRGIGYFIIALLAFLAQFILAIYIMAKY